MNQQQFNIQDYVTFNDKGRAVCPACQSSKGEGFRKLNLSILDNGAYHCFRGCTPDDIRSALGVEKNKVVPSALVVPPTAPKNITVSPQKVREVHEQLMIGNNAALSARTWLAARGIGLNLMKHYQLGITRAKCGDRHLPAITIPFSNADGTAYFQKKRLVPWMSETEIAQQLGDKAGEYKPWSQYGIPAMVWFTHRPDGATATWLCEGEWDAILLGHQVQQAELPIAVATFTCGCQTVPPVEQLDLLPGTVYIFYDRNDQPLKNGDRPAEVGVKRVCEKLTNRARVALVPMADDCTVKGWDVSNALLSGFTVADFEKAAAQSQAAPDQTKHKDNPLRSRLVWNDDLMARAPDFTEWLVDDILTADELFLLAAGPRSGKSLLAMTLAKAVAEGGEFLGRPVTQGTVIYVCLEDGDAKLKEREIAQGWSEGLPVAWFQKFKLSELPHLIEIAEELDPRLIILDTLSRIKDASISESSAEMSQVLEPLQEMARDLGCCVLLVHHTGKVTVENASSLDIFDTIRGSSAIRAVCRGSLVIASADRSYRLYVENGWKKLDLSVVLDGNTWSWKLLGQWKPDGNLNASQRDQVVEFLKQVGEATIEQIHDATQIPKKSLYEQLSRLQSAEDADGKVIKVGSRRKYSYRLALFNTIQQLNSVLNSSSSDSENDRGAIQQKNISSIRGDQVKPDHDCICNDDQVSGSPPPPTNGDIVEYHPSNVDGESVSPIQQLFNTPSEELALNPDTEDVSAYSTRYSTPDPKVIIPIGSKVEILTGRFAGKLCMVEGFNDEGKAIVRANRWYVTREYSPVELRLLNKGGEGDANG